MASSSTSALTQQYYESLAADAAESGSVHVEECMATNGGVATWTASNNLTPASKCDGTAASGASLYLINKPTYRTTYTVEPAATSSTGAITIKVVGKTELIRQSNSNAWKTYSKTTVMRKALGVSWATNDPSLQSKIIPADIVTSTAEFGQAVALSGDTVVIAAHRENLNAGAVYVYVRDGMTWEQQAKISPYSAGSVRYFGESVAIDGDTLVVGAPIDDEKGAAAGAAFVYKRSDGEWTLQEKLFSDDGSVAAASSRRFGSSVAIDGDTIVVGGPYISSTVGWFGNVFVFTRNNDSWEQQAKLGADDRGWGDLFGGAVAIDGDTVVIGARADDDNGASSGSAYVFTRTGATWVQRAKLTAIDGAAGDIFGYSVDIDKDTVVVGALNDQDKGTSSGSAYVFKRSNAIWAQEGKLLGDAIRDSSLFGQSVAIDSGVIAVADLELALLVLPISLYMTAIPGGSRQRHLVTHVTIDRVMI